MAAENLNVRDFFAGRSVLITGATGFIGKVLVEKLLRSFPDIEKIYVLIRPKKGKTIDERVSRIVNTPLFEKLKRTQPDVIQKKLKAIAGDVLELGLGLSKADKNVLIENVSVVFHGAASVRFDDPFKRAIFLNTRGTREVIKLASEIKNLVSFLHISTTYCHIDKAVVGEQAYPALADWQKTIEIAEHYDDYTLDTFAYKYVSGMTNTYTFSKGLAENVVYDLCNGKIPAVLFRPSIVISTLQDPIPGWIDNFNGPVALLVASGKGILRTSYADPNIRADYIPVDIVVRALILATWQKAIQSNNEDRLKVNYYNASNNNMYAVTTGQLADFGLKLIWEAPLSNILWFPGGGVTHSKLKNYIYTILFQVLPAIAVDRLLVFMDKKPMLLNIQRRIYTANMALQVFVTNQWDFLNDKAFGLRDTLQPEEQNEYGFDPFGIDVYNFIRTSFIYGRRYLLNEDDSNIESAKTNLYRMYLLDRTVKLLFYVFVLWFFVYKVGIVEHTNRFGLKMFDNLFTWE